MRRALTREQAQARTRELVLGAAEELFLTKGLHATTVAEIAATAGRTQGSIYGNFTNKEALCLAVLERRYEQIFAELEENWPTLQTHLMTSWRPWRNGGGPMPRTTPSPFWSPSSPRPRGAMRTSSPP